MTLPRETASPPRRELDGMIARLLTIGSYVSIALLAGGLAAMIVAGVSPWAAPPVLDPGSIVADLLTGRPEGFLWLGLVAAIATPIARVLAALVGFVRAAEWEMAAISAAILGVITLSVILARLAEA